jgi:hypothetical protein
MLLTSLTLAALDIGELRIFATNAEISEFFAILPMMLASIWVPFESAFEGIIVLRIFKINEELLSLLTSSVA